MQVSKKSKMTIQQPDLTVTKANQEKAGKIYDNFVNGVIRQVKGELGAFSTWATIMRFVTKSKVDPSEKHIYEVIKRFERDKVNSQVALQISDITTRKAQSLHKITLIKMIPFLAGMLGMIVLISLTIATRPLEFSNPTIQKYLIISAIFLPLFIWGYFKRGEAKLDMVATNILLQASSAYASAKMQGKGGIAAMQNLGQMRRKAKAMEQKNKDKTAKK